MPLRQNLPLSNVQTVVLGFLQQQYMVSFIQIKEKGTQTSPPSLRLKTTKIKIKYNKIQILSTQFHLKNNLHRSPSFYLSFEVSFSISSWSGASSLLSIRLNSYVPTKAEERARTYYLHLIPKQISINICWKLTFK